MSEPADSPKSSGPTTGTVVGRRQALVALLIALLPLLLLAWRFNWLADDAFISFRYAANLAEGQGLRFNPGSQPPVEGYSNLLWVLVMAAFEAIAVPSPVVSRLLSLACAVVLVWRLCRCIVRHLAGGFFSLLAPLLFFATLPPVAVWSTSGLATLPFTLVLFLLFEGLFGTGEKQKPVDLPLATAAAVLTVLIRAEGFAWAAVLLGCAAVAALLRRDRACLRPLVVVAVVTLLVSAALFGFRLLYFGEWLPNTAHAKVTVTARTLLRGIDYVIVFLLHFPHLVLVVAAGAWTAVRRPGLRGVLLPATAVVLMVLGYAVWISGDFMAMGRLLVPALPFVALLLTAAGAAIPRPAARSPLPLLIALGLYTLSLLPAFDLHLVPSAIRQRFHFRLNQPAADYRSEYQQWRFMRANSERWSLEGRLVRRHTRPGSWAIRGVIGAYGYYSDLLIYDRCGLVNREVARRRLPAERLVSPGHDKCVPAAFFYRYRPTYYHAGFCTGLRTPPGYGEHRVPVQLPSEADPTTPAELCLIELEPTSQSSAGPLAAFGEGGLRRRQPVAGDGWRVAGGSRESGAGCRAAGDGAGNRECPPPDA